jgi:MGT family glycosyltransferase
VLAEETRAVEPALPWPEDDPTPLVLLSFSTVQVQRTPALLQRALDALGPLPVHVVATTGTIVEAAELNAPANAAVLPFASHDALMRRAGLVVTHGGHGTAMRSLRHGVPMVLTPAGGGDQPVIGALMDEWGAGRALPRDPDVAAIRAAVEAVLGEPRYRARAREIGAALHGRDGAEMAADALESLAASSQRRGKVTALSA